MRTSRIAKATLGTQSLILNKIDISNEKVVGLLGNALIRSRALLYHAKRHPAAQTLANRTRHRRKRITQRRLVYDEADSGPYSPFAWRCSNLSVERSRIALVH